MDRKKILIISYYYPPCNSIASLRPSSWANEFSKNHDVKVITRAWQGNEKNWNDLGGSYAFEKSVKQKDNLEEIYLPYASNLKNKNLIRTFFNLLTGKLDFELNTMSFAPYIEQLFLTWKPDVILVTCPPLSLLNLADHLHRKYQIPFVADFRDFENNVILDSRKNTLKEKIIFHLRVAKVRRILKKAVLISSINQPFDTYFKHLIPYVPSFISYNGFEASVFGEFKPLTDTNTCFTVSIIGTLYPDQAYEIILHGFNLFLLKNTAASIHFNFIGTNAVKEVGETIKQIMPNESHTLVSRLPRVEALKVMEKSHVLFHVGWKGHKGVYSGKIFEYLGAKRNILIAPSDEDVIEGLLQETHAGEVANTPEQVCAYLERKYAEWEAKGYIDYHGKEEKIAFYSRENQAKILINKIEEVLKK